MDYQAIFKRNELKYLLNRHQYDKIRKFLSSYTALDPYGLTTIRNVYYDTDSYLLIRRSMDKPIYKEKLRMRSYRTRQMDEPVFVELKKKYKGVVYKRRLSMIPVISPRDFLLCLGCSLILGLVLALTYTYRTRYTKSFLFTLSLLPAVVCVVIMMVNGNIGTGVAVAGAFSLVRFRSAPGSAKEIGVLFLAMGTGLIAGMGYLGYSEPVLP